MEICYTVQNGEASKFRSRFFFFVKVKVTFTILDFETILVYRQLEKSRSRIDIRITPLCDCDSVS